MQPHPSAPFLIYNASAGAGKTHTLVRSFLFRVLSSPYPNEVQRLLAITFTNKAAQEMKDRVLEKLALFGQELSKAKADDMFQQLAAQCQLSPEELHRRSRKAFAYTLHHFGHLNVVTIDKLTHQIIRTFARDLGLHPSFDIVLDAKDFMAEVVARVLSKAGADIPLTKVLVAYVLQKADELKAWDVTSEVTNIAEMYLNENHMVSLAALMDKPFAAFSQIDKTLKEQISIIKGPIAEQAAALLVQLKQTGLPLQVFPYQQLPTLLERLSQGDWSKPLHEQKDLVKRMASGNLLNASATQTEKTAFAPLEQPITTLFDAYDQLWRQAELLALLRKNIVPLSLIQRIGQEVTETQEQRNVRLLSFFNKHIADSIKDTATPFIYERLGVRYRHFFVDEFQDTSVLQWSNLIPLFAHALEGEQERGSLVIVGDAKQSIYRWRGGVPEQFMRLANKQSPFTVNLAVEPLPVNYRSAAEIISFNNEFFKKAALVLPQKTQQDLYIKACTQQPNKKTGGYITIDTIEGENKAAQYEAYQKEVVARVLDCLSHGHEYRDICVLVRKNEQGVAIATALTESGIPITSSESLLIGQSKEVNFLVALIKLRHAPTDKQAQYAVLEEAALAQEDPYMWTIAQRKHKIQDVLAHLSTNRFDFSVFCQMTLYASLEYAIWAFSLTSELTAHIQGFLDEVLKLEAKKEATTTQFLAHWEQQKEKWAVRPPEKRNAVQIMTIHKAKGLAFPVVIVPFADSLWMDGKEKYAWFPLPKDEYTPFTEMLLPVTSKLKELGEGAKQTFNTVFADTVIDTLNTLYVAMTRPVEELHLLTLKGKTPEEPKGLADVFAYVFPTLKENKIIEGNRNKPAKPKTPTAAVAPTTWTFNLGHVSKTMAVVRAKNDEAQYGLLFHEVMAKVDVPQDVLYALAQTRAEERLTPVLYERLKKQLEEVVQHKDLEAFFSPQNTVYCERPLLTAEGTIIRPDRFVLTRKKEALLLDYKTGQYTADHEKQLKEYANCLTISGYKIKRSLLVYAEKTLVLKEV